MDPVNLQSQTRSSKPPGIRFLHRISSSALAFRTYQAIVLVLTFIAYACYHAMRKPTSIVKSVLDPKESGQGISGEQEPGSGWAPFNNSDGTMKLGSIDVAFLSAYSIGMFFAGHLGDRVDLPILLAIGMVLTGMFTSLFQSTGWPSVMAVMRNWFGKSRRGLIMVIWNADTSIGSITGSLLASALLKYGWTWSFVFPGILISLLGVIVFLFLPVSPEAVGVRTDGDGQFKPQDKKNVIEEPLMGGGTEVEEAVGFVKAWRIAGVAPFALSLFFSKLVA